MSIIRIEGKPILHSHLQAINAFIAQNEVMPEGIYPIRVESAFGDVYLGVHIGLNKEWFSKKDMSIYDLNDEAIRFEQFKKKGGNNYIASYDWKIYKDEALTELHEKFN